MSSSNFVAMLSLVDNSSEGLPCIIKRGICSLQLLLVGHGGWHYVIFHRGIKNRQLYEEYWKTTLKAMNLHHDTIICIVYKKALFFALVAFSHSQFPSNIYFKKLFS